MLQYIRQITILNKIFNIHGNEWPKISLAWFIRFFYRAGFVIGWTVLVAMFVSRYGISSLPYLFILNAGFSILGSLFYSTFLDKIPMDKIMVVTIFVAGSLLFAAAQLSKTNPVWAFALLIVAVAIFLNQLRIMTCAYTEEMFTPLESERTFPIIEASDTFGGILAGITVMTLANSIEVYKFIYLWVAALFLMVPLILFFENISEGIVLIKEKRRQMCSVGLLTKIKKIFSSGKHLAYVKGLFMIVFFQWMLFNLLEFQYTKAVYQSVSDVVLDSGSGFEHAFVHDLGTLFILFSVSALLVQLFIGSRLINHLGVIGSMLIHPIVTIFSLLGLSFSFRFGTAVLAKNNFTITTVIHTNAYHSAYYAVKESVRGHVRELLEGIVRPVGAVAGTLGLILLQRFFIGNNLIVSVNVAMMVTALLIFYVTYRQQRKYTEVAVDDLLSSKDRKTRANAIDILAQRGHGFGIRQLKKVLLDPDESVSIRVRILHSLGELQDLNAIPEIMECLKSDKSAIRVAALDAFANYRFSPSSSYSTLLTKYNLTESLRKLYSTEKNEAVISRMIFLMSKLSNIATVEFLVNVINSGKAHNKAEAIRALGNFNDIHIAEFLIPYLDSGYPREQINAAIALRRFKPFRRKSEDLIYDYLYSKKSSKIAYALYAIGELRLKSKKKVCLNYLDSKNADLQMNSAIALSNMGYQDGIPVIVNLLFSKNDNTLRKVRRLLRNVDVRIFKNIDKIVRHIVVEEIERLMHENKTDSLNGFKPTELVDLRRLYCLVEEYDEVELIDNLIKLNTN